MQLERGRVDGVGRRTVEADRRDFLLDQGRRRLRIGIAPAGPVGIGSPIATIVGVEEDDVPAADLVEVRLELGEAQWAGGALGDVDRYGVGDEALEPDLVKR